MKIFHLVLGKANPNRQNGVNRVVHQLATEQTNLGYDVTIIGITKNAENEIIYRNYKTIWINYTLRIPRFIKRILLDEPQETIIHIHGGFIFRFFLFVLFLVRHNIKYVFTPHGTYTKGAMSKNHFFKSFYFKLIETSVLKGAYKIQCLGHIEKFELEHLVELNNVVLIPNGQDFKEIEIFKSLELKTQNPLIFGFCGRLEAHHKGLDVFIESIIDYKTHGGKAKFWFVGDGSFRNELEHSIKKHNLQDVIVFGSLFGVAKHEIISQFDFFFHPSRNEGLPMAVIEALSYGIPCVVTKETSMDSYISEGNAGFILEKLSSQDLQVVFKKIELLTFEERRILKSNSFKTSEVNFKWKNIAQELILNYK